MICVGLFAFVSGQESDWLTLVGCYAAHQVQPMRRHESTYGAALQRSSDMRPANLCKYGAHSIYSFSNGSTRFCIFAVHGGTTHEIHIHAGIIGVHR